MLDDRGIDGLSGRLLEIAPNPARVAELYAILGEFCHKHRNRLNNLKLGLYLARRGGGGSSCFWTEAEARYGELEETMDRMQGLCRPIHVAKVRLDLGSLLDDRRDLWSSWGLRPDWNSPRAPAEGCFDPCRLGDALDAWVKSRVTCQTSRSKVKLAWEAMTDGLQLDWEENGAAPMDPADISLPMLVRVVVAHGGSCRVSIEDGLRLTLRWPSGTAVINP